MDDKIINRVRKMLALSKDEAASEGERDNALRMAHATLAKYNLSMAAVDAPPEEARGSDVLRIRHRMWMVTVHNAVAKLFFCHLFMSKRGQYIDMTFVGKESNITTAKDIATYLCNSILKENKNQISDQSWLASFNKGAASRIYERCLDLRKEADKAPEKATGTAIVLASLYKREEAANSDYIRDVMKINLSTSKERRSNVHGSAYDAGRAYGGKLNLNRQVTGNSTTNQKRLAG